jgi:phenylacetate-CoA ligase
MKIAVERAESGAPDQDRSLAKKIGERIKTQVLVSAEIGIVSYRSLPRSERKTKRVFDNREI